MVFRKGFDLVVAFFECLLAVGGLIPYSFFVYLSQICGECSSIYTRVRGDLGRWVSACADVWGFRTPASTQMYFSTGGSIP